MTLDWEDQIAVSKLAAILRLADSLDRSQSQRIREIDCSREGGRLVISVPHAEDLSLEQMTINQKCGLFEDIFGMRVLLRSAQ